MAKSKSRANSEPKMEAPETLDEHPFYGIKLDPEQKVLVDTIWSKDYDIVFVNAKAGTGKAQPLDTNIPTPDGWRKLGDIKVGDYVFDRTGSPTKVIGVYNQGMQEAYRVTLKDGRSTICAKEHLWSYFKMDGQRTQEFLATETLGSMIEVSVRRPKDGTCRYAIPINQPVKYSHKDFEIDPYVVGVFLGDGCCSERSLTMSSNDEDIVNEVARLTDTTPKKSHPNNYSWIFYMNDSLREKLISQGKLASNDTITKRLQTKVLFGEMPELMCAAGKKRIPDQYKYGDIEQRYALIQGLMDTDGCVRRDRKHSVTFCSTSEALINDVKEVLNSLGYSSSVSSHKRKNREHSSTEYELHIFIAHKDKYKLFRYSPKKKVAKEFIDKENHSKYDRMQIRNIEDLGYECEMVCIYVDNKEHLYLTDDYIVTHNTTVTTAVANLLVQYGRYDGIVYIMSPYGEKKQGWLPGTITEKSSVYFEAFYQALIECGINPITAINDESMVNQKNGTGYITCITDTFLRGTNLNNVVVVLDESQNMTVPQLQKVLSRIGPNTKVVVIGHDKQCDLEDKSQSGFTKYIEHFREQKRAAVCELKTNHRGWISQWADEIQF